MTFQHLRAARSDFSRSKGAPCEHPASAQRTVSCGENYETTCGACGELTDED